MENSAQLSGNIIEMLGIGSLPLEKRAEIVEDAVALVERRVMLRLMERLTDEQVAEAEKAGDTPEAIVAFLSSTAPDFMDVLGEEVERVRAELASADDLDV